MERAVTLKLTKLNKTACFVLMNGAEYAKANGLNGKSLTKALKRADDLRHEYGGTGQLDHLCTRWQNS